DTSCLGTFPYSTQPTSLEEMWTRQRYLDRRHVIRIHFDVNQQWAISIPVGEDSGHRFFEFISIADGKTVSAERLRNLRKIRPIQFCQRWVLSFCLKLNIFSAITPVITNDNDEIQLFVDCGCKLAKASQHQTAIA